MTNGLPVRTQLVLLAVAALVTFGALSLFWAGSGSSAPEPETAAAQPQSTESFKPTKEQWNGLGIQKISDRVFRPTDIAEGNIALDDDLTTPVFSPYSGRVVRVVANLGDSVAKGAPLFVIDASEIVQGINTLITAVATEKTAHAQLTQAQLNEQRAHDLYTAKGGALKDWQQSRTDLASAQSTLKSADIALAAARNQLRILGKSDAEIAAIEAQPTEAFNPTATVSAPIAGIVTQRQIGLGEYIQSVSGGASNPVYTIGNLSKVWLLANVREADAAAMKIGLPVDVTVPAYPGRTFAAKVSWVASAIDPNTHRLPVRADIENPDGALKPNMFARFAIETGAQHTAPAVPESAIVYEGDAAHVWVAGNDGTLTARAIRIGQISGDDVEVMQGLTAGEQIVTSGSLFIDRAAKGD